MDNACGGSATSETNTEVYKFLILVRLNNGFYGQHAYDEESEAIHELAMQTANLSRQVEIMMRQVKGVVCSQCGNHGHEIWSCPFIREFLEPYNPEPMSKPYEDFYNPWSSYKPYNNCYNMD
ncbi:hypothetical protein LWI29_035616 [Acer saccharum]|uniref:Uncharacterized protein n=1 Tax=Acer saccharum TaxID=4024 RepID=A0AA39SB52_ACESA|nr:hypothetical protein LWI29_035616 [Acer saccharum]